MSNPVFVRPVYNYDSYFDLHRLIELSGYQTVYVSEMDIEDVSKCYILITANGEWGGGWPHAKARLIHLQLEFETTKEPLYPGIAEKWTSCPAHAKRIQARYVPLGSHPDLPLTPYMDIPKHYDVATLWCPSGRRYAANGELEAAGLSVAPNAWGEDRDRLLKRSRAMCEVRQWDEHPFIGAQRWALAAAYHLPMITETLLMDGVFGNRYCLMTDIAKMGEFTKEWMQPHNMRELTGYGERLHERLCYDLSFRNVIESAI